MCKKHESKKHELHNCGSLTKTEIKCCCVEKENPEENSEHIKNVLNC